MVNQMDLPLLDLIVAINFRLIFSRKKDYCFILEQILAIVNILSKKLDFKLNTVNQVGIILLPLCKSQVFEFYCYPKSLLFRISINFYQFVPRGRP